jgi:quinol monooxygenase YgiN
MVNSTIRLKMPEGKVRDAMGILASVAERSRVLSGCLGFRIYRDTQEAHVIMIEALWRGREDLDRHLRSEEYGRVLLVMEMASAAPEIRFDEVSKSTGFETIEKARCRPEVKW